MIEINALRQLVEEIAQKKDSIGALELGAGTKKNSTKFSLSNNDDAAKKCKDLFTNEAVEQSYPGTSQQVFFS